MAASAGKRARDREEQMEMLEEEENRFKEQQDMDSVSPVTKHAGADAFSKHDLEEVRLCQMKLESIKKLWRRSRAGKVVAKVLKDKILKRKDIKIEEAMCLGLGSFNLKGNGYSVSLNQLAAFCCWLDILKSKHQITKIYCQDPVFDKLDVRFLKALGFTVIWDNAAHAHLKNTTALFSAFCTWDTLFPLLVHAFPALYIGPDSHELCECPHHQRIRPRLGYLLQLAPVRSFFESRASFPFPNHLNEDFKLDDLKFYWRASKKEKVDEEVKEYYANETKIDADDLDAIACDCGDKDSDSDIMGDLDDSTSDDSSLMDYSGDGLEGDSDDMALDHVQVQEDIERGRQKTMRAFFKPDAGKALGKNKITT